MKVDLCRHGNFTLLHELFLWRKLGVRIIHGGALYMALYGTPRTKMSYGTYRQGYWRKWLQPSRYWCRLPRASRRPSKIFHRKLGPCLSRQLGLQHHKPRLCPKVHGHSPIFLYSSSNPNSRRQTATSSTGKRNPNPSPETGNLQGSTKGSEEGIPLIILSGSKKILASGAPS